MKIIKPSRHTKTVRTSSASENREGERDGYAKAATIKSSAGVIEPRPKPAKSWPKKKRSRSADKRSKLSTSDSRISLDNTASEEEFDFDTSNLEAMPKDETFAVPLLAVPLEGAALEGAALEGKKRRRSELQAEKISEPLALVTDPAKKEFNELFARGLRLLAMREHSVKEITKKLFDKVEAFDRAGGIDSTEGSDNVERTATIYAVVDDLIEKKYLSDERFTEVYIRSRANRGFGPVKIKAELKDKGVSHTLIQDYLDQGAASWFDLAKSQHDKKYGNSPISDYSTWAKHARFLQSRGFNMDQIHCAIAQPADH